MKTMIQIQGLTKHFYGPRNPFQVKPLTTALSQVSLICQQQRSYALLGPNGAGKTTLLRVLATALIPDSGQVMINGRRLGRDDLAIKAATGYVPSDNRSFYYRLTGRQNLELYAALYGLRRPAAQRRIAALFNRFGVTYGDKIFSSYSTGMQRKFSIIRSLLHEPDILLLDEPTKSLDENSTAVIRQLLKEEVDKGKTVIVATHQLDEAATLARSYIFLHRGKLLEAGDVSDATGHHSGSLTEIYRRLMKNAF